MTSLVTLVQGVLFGTAHTLGTTMLVQYIWPDAEAMTPFFSRWLLFNFLCAFLLGVSLGEHFYERTTLLDISAMNQKRVTFRPSFGMFIGAASLLTLCSAVIIFSQETCLFVSALMCCMYIYARSIARQRAHSILNSAMAGITVALAASVMVSQSKSYDELSTSFARLIWSAKAPQPFPVSYLARKGGPFHDPVFVPLLLAVFSVLLVYY